MIGDILVESGVITAAQREIIAAEQSRLELESPTSQKENRQSQGGPEVSVTGPMAQGTKLSGPFSSTIIKEAYRGVTFIETRQQANMEEFEFTCKI